MRWYSLWPLVLALVATPFAVKTAEILPLMGTPGLHRLCLLYPFVLLARRHEIGLSEHLGEQLAQALLYLQFPLYAVLFMLVARFKTFAAAATTIIVLHLCSAAAAWILILLPAHG